MARSVSRLILFFLFLFTFVFTWPGVCLMPMSSWEERGSFVEGDMVLPPGLSARAGIIGEMFRWPNATLVVQIDKDFCMQTLIQLI